MAEAEGSIALLAGASGLTGGLTLDALLAAPEVSRVIAVTRRPLGREHPRLANRIVQFERLESQLKGTVCDVALCCLQPSMLLAWRAEMRPLELVASAVMPLLAPLMRGKYAPYRAIPASTVAAAMLGATRSGRRGVQRYTYEGIQSLARLTAPRTRPLTPAKTPARAR